MSGPGEPADDAYYRYPAGSAEHYAAYEKAFAADDGVTFPFPDDPYASYEADHAYELAYESLEDEDGGWFSPPLRPDFLPHPEQPAVAIDDFEAEPWLRVSRDHGTGRCRRGGSDSWPYRLRATLHQRDPREPNSWGSLRSPACGQAASHQCRFRRGSRGG
jgi:hypothetical protein